MVADEEQEHLRQRVAELPKAGDLVALLGNQNYFGLWRIVATPQAVSDIRASVNAGTFDVIQTKLKELAAGDWDGRSSLKRKHIQKDAPLPIKKAFVSGNDRLIWSVHCVYDPVTDKAIQAIKGKKDVWRIGDHKLVEKVVPKIAVWQKSYSTAFTGACKVRIYDDSGCCTPQTFDSNILDGEYLLDLTESGERQDIDPSVISDKIYTISDTTLNAIQKLGHCADFVFDVSREENKIILANQLPTFILGRSGTGKTTCLVFKLLLNLLISRNEKQETPRQLLITRSEKLADKLRAYVQQLMRTHCPNLAPPTSNTTTSELEIRELQRAEVDLANLKEGDFPLILTFEGLLKGVRQLMQRDASPPASVTGNGIAAKVTFDRFIESYWPRFPAQLKRNVPVDICFAEILGNIKGLSTDGQVLTKEEYIQRRCTLPLTDTEKSAIYGSYLQYEKLKSRDNEHDDIDDLKELLATLSKDSDTYRKLSTTFKELYVDEVQDHRLMEIQFLLSLIESPKDVHIAGDTAQSISRDATFRFNDVKRIFHDHYQPKVGTSKQALSLIKPELSLLHRNYRSHKGIVNFAAEILDCLWRGFPNSVDRLKKEVGNYSGPAPTLFGGFKMPFLNELLSDDSTRDNQERTLGAPCIVIVRDEEEKMKLKASGMLGRLAVLTILDSKGMEFSEVILFNFFSSNKQSYSHYRALEQLVAGEESDGQFDAFKHATLCSELKLLYVAVTRACNTLALFESDMEIGKLLSRTWAEKGLDGQKPRAFLIPTFAGAANVDAVLKRYKLTRKAEATPEEWISLGEAFLEKGLYDDALYFFERSGHKQGCLLAQGHLYKSKVESILAQRDNLKKRLNSKDLEELKSLCKKAAKYFELAKHISEAASCLRMLDLYKELGDLFNDHSRQEEAAAAYLKGKHYALAAAVYEKSGEYVKPAEILMREKQYQLAIEFMLRAKGKSSTFRSNPVYEKYAMELNVLVRKGEIAKTLSLSAASLLSSASQKLKFYLDSNLTTEIRTLCLEKRLDEKLDEDLIKSVIRHLWLAGKFHAIIMACHRQREQFWEICSPVIQWAVDAVATKHAHENFERRLGVSGPTSREMNCRECAKEIGACNFVLDDVPEYSIQLKQKLVEIRVGSWISSAASAFRKMMWFFGDGLNAEVASLMHFAWFYAEEFSKLLRILQSADNLDSLQARALLYISGAYPKDPWSTAPLSQGPAYISNVYPAVSAAILSDSAAGNRMPVPIEAPNIINHIEAVKGFVVHMAIMVADRLTKAVRLVEACSPCNQHVFTHTENGKQAQDQCPQPHESNDILETFPDDFWTLINTGTVVYRVSTFAIIVESFDFTRPTTKAQCAALVQLATDQKYDRQYVNLLARYQERFKFEESVYNLLGYGAKEQKLSLQILERGIKKTFLKRAFGGDIQAVAISPNYWSKTLPYLAINLAMQVEYGCLPESYIFEHLGKFEKLDPVLEWFVKPKASEFQFGTRFAIATTIGLFKSSVIDKEHNYLPTFLFLLERMAMYLILKGGPFDNVLPRSWIPRHLRNRFLKHVFPSGPDSMLRGPHSAQPLPEFANDDMLSLKLLLDVIHLILEKVFDYDPGKTSLRLDQKFIVPGADEELVQPERILRQAVNVLVTIAMAINHARINEARALDTKMNAERPKFTKEWKKVVDFVNQHQNVLGFQDLLTIDGRDIHNVQVFAESFEIYKDSDREKLQVLAGRSYEALELPSTAARPTCLNLPASLLRRDLWDYMQKESTCESTPLNVHEERRMRLVKMLMLKKQTLRRRTSGLTYLAEFERHNHLKLSTRTSFDLCRVVPLVESIGLLTKKFLCSLISTKDPVYRYFEDMVAEMKSILRMFEIGCLGFFEGESHVNEFLEQVHARCCEIRGITLIIMEKRD